MQRFLPPLQSVLVLAAVALSGCGSSTDDVGTAPETSKSSAMAGPDCAEVWSGETLPAEYDGCVDQSEFVEAERWDCASGQVIITFDDRYYAVPGGPVNDVGAPLEDSPQYRKALRGCGG